MTQTAGGMSMRVAIVYSVVLCGFICAASATAETASDRKPVIDVHVHASPAATAPTMQRYLQGHPEVLELQGLLQTQAAATNAEVLEGTIAAMKQYNVVRAVVSGPFLESYVKASPERVISAIGGIDGRKVNLEQIRESIVSKRFTVIGELMNQFAGIAPDDARLESLFALAAELDVPVGIHMGMAGPGIPTYRAQLGNPLLLEGVLMKRPKLRIYVMHAGYPMLDNMVALMQSYPSVYVDTAEINWARPRASFHRHLRGLVEAGLGKRIMHGSDQMAWPKAMGIGIEAIEEADYLSDAQKRDILCNNAARFFRLGDDVCR
jgi:uncharacterized protein